MFNSEKPTTINAIPTKTKSHARPPMNTVYTEVHNNWLNESHILKNVSHTRAIIMINPIKICSIPFMFNPPKIVTFG